MAVVVGPFESASLALISALGANPEDVAMDGWTDPSGGARTLENLGGNRPSALVRVFGNLGESEPGSAQTPAQPGWMVVTKGSAEVRMSVLGEGPAAVETRRVTRVVVESAPLPDGGDGAVGRVLLHLDRKASANAPLLVAEAWAGSEEIAVSRVRKVAAQLARTLSVPASLPAVGRTEEAEGRSETAPPADTNETGAALSAKQMARYSWRGEGPRLVLRDFGSRGPREGAFGNFVVGSAFAALATGAWVMFSRAVQSAGFGSAQALAWLGGGALLTLAAVAFLGIAQFARRYSAISVPLLAVGDGKLNVMPWVSRKGAVMLDPEGRFGAAIALGEVRGASVVAREQGFAVSVATDHGPFDVLVTEDKALADLLRAAVARTLVDLAPRPKATAKQRARAKAQGSGEPAPV